MSSGLNRIIFLLLGVSAIIVSYFYYDRAVVNYFKEYHFRHYKIFHYLQQLPELLLILTAPGIIFYFIQWKRKQVNKFSMFCLIASAAILVGVVTKILLKFCFGRYWPDTFIENNLSYLHDGAYGFNPFHWGAQYKSFPSGHMITMVVFVLVVSEFYPRFKWLCAAGCLIVAFSLISFYYHFVSDVIAGFMVGCMVYKGISNFFKKKLDPNTNN